MKEFSLAALLALLQCGAPSQTEVSYPLEVKGSVNAPFTARNGWDVTLTQGTMALGPIYFCTTEAASPSLCPTAQGEFTKAASFNTLGEDVQQLGTVKGLSGDIGSAQYDLGISWTNTQNQPTALEGSVDGHTAHFEGTARKGTVVLNFVADIDVAPRDQGTRAIQGARTGASIQDSKVVVRVVVDAVAWWKLVDFSEFEAAPGPVVRIKMDSRAANAIILGMTTSAPPVFEWREP